MARDNQTATAQVTRIPLINKGGSNDILPESLAVFRGSIALDGSGVGDTADCRITLPLPANYAWQLNSFWGAIKASSNENLYRLGLLEMYYAPKDVGFGQTTQIDFGVQVAEGAFMTGSAPAGNYCPLQLGFTAANADVTGSDSTDYTSVGYMNACSPFRMLTIGQADGGTDPVLWLATGTQVNAPTATLRYAITFCGYTLEQRHHAEMFAGLPSR